MHQFSSPTSLTFNFTFSLFDPALQLYYNGRFSGTCGRHGPSGGLRAILDFRSFVWDPYAPDAVSHASQHSRSTLLIGTVAFSVERSVFRFLIMRWSPVLTHYLDKRTEWLYSPFGQFNPEMRVARLSPGLATYMQISFGMGFIGIANDMVNLVRCLLVNPTYGSETYAQYLRLQQREALWSHLSRARRITRLEGSG